MHQYSVTVNNARLDQIETTISTAPQLRFYTGAMPATCATAASGTLLDTQALPSDWLAAAAAAVKAKAGTWTGAFDAAGTVGYFRIYDSAGSVCHIQGLVTLSVPLTTNALTAANGNVLNFAATTGVSVGMNISGTGIVAGATVIAVTGTTVTMSHSTIAGVANAASITFGGDMTLDNLVAAVSQAWTVNSFQITANNQ
jgi:hypothetical protein